MPLQLPAATAEKESRKAKEAVEEKEKAVEGKAAEKEALGRTPRPRGEEPPQRSKASCA